jgi:hypothetical protein
MFCVPERRSSTIDMFAFALPNHAGQMQMSSTFVYFTSKQLAMDSWCEALFVAHQVNVLDS